MRTQKGQGAFFLKKPRLTQFTDEVHHPIVATEGWVQVDKEFGIKARYLPLQDVWDSLTIIFLILPLPSRNDGPSAGQVREVWLKQCMKIIITLTLKDQARLSDFRRTEKENV